MQQLTYEEARYLMRPADLIAFGGKGVISNIIKIKTGSNVSHVGSVLQACSLYGTNLMINQIIESTSLGAGFSGVQISRLSTRIKKHDGEVWWLPMKEDIRRGMNYKKYFSFLLAQEGKEYDAPQAIGSAFDLLPDQDEDFSKLFCSELCAAGLEEGKVIKEINASEKTPIDVCLLPIWDPPYQLKGDNKELL